LRYLEKKGYASIERNYCTPHGEIDLLVHGTGTGAAEAALVFVEIKLRRGTGFGNPLEAVTPKKQARICLTAEQYLAEQGEDCVAGFDEVRFDVVGILTTAWDEEAGGQARGRCFPRCISVGVLGAKLPFHPMRSCYFIIVRSFGSGNPEVVTRVRVETW